MIVAQINATYKKGSTGKICASLSKILNEKGIENYVLFSNGNNSDQNAFSFGSFFYQKLQALKARMFGNNGFTAVWTTKRLLRLLDKIKPDIIHLHNLHSNDINLELLFSYIREKKIKTIYTFHDCWAFTGYCTYFSFNNCSRYKCGCGQCPIKKQYSWFFDRSSEMQTKKRLTLKGVDFTIVTPSKWLARIVKESFLKDHDVRVINNGIELEVFKPRESSFRNDYSIPDDKFVLLGVAFDWGHRKGLDIFVELAKRMGDNYQIVLVGTNNQIDKRLPKNIISIHRTHNQEELSAIYSASDLFINPTREDNYPTVNMESLACGTPVLTFNTGGSPEMIDDTCGAVVSSNSIDALEKEIRRICETKPFSREACQKKAKEFDANAKLSEYLKLYEAECFN